LSRIIRHKRGGYRCFSLLRSIRISSSGSNVSSARCKSISAQEPRLPGSGGSDFSERRMQWEPLGGDVASLRAMRANWARVLCRCRIRWRASVMASWRSCQRSASMADKIVWVDPSRSLGSMRQRRGLSQDDVETLNQGGGASP